MRLVKTSAKHQHPGDTPSEPETAQPDQESGASRRSSVSPAVPLSTAASGFQQMITARNVVITYPGTRTGPAVIDGVDLTIGAGNIVSLIGPSGCGKSTLLKAIAGLVLPTKGQIDVAGTSARIAAQRRLVGLVFQEANLLPWKSALENAAFLLRISDRTVSRKAAEERAAANLELVGLGHALRKLPSQLSGGMRQRVSIARALTLNPEILLMDEPFGALDAITREEMSHLMLDIWERTRKTIVLVTHSIDEAVLLSHDVHVMGAHPGRIICSITVPLDFPRGSTSYADPRFRETEMLLRDRLVESHGRQGNTLTGGDRK
jgi:NitT/TauT family transport system ATP-binding protein